jgi:hypothetical protein
MHNDKLRPDRRCVRRWNVMWPATLVIEGHEYHCTITDLSEFGARIRVKGLHYGPSVATLQSERFGHLEGRVQWARGVEAGLRFEAAPEAVMQLLKPDVPGMGRRDKVVDAPPPVPQRRSLGRIIREKISQAA